MNAIHRHRECYQADQAARLRQLMADERTPQSDPDAPNPNGDQAADEKPGCPLAAIVFAAYFVLALALARVCKGLW